MGYCALGGDLVSAQRMRQTCVSVRDGLVAVRAEAERQRWRWTPTCRPNHCTRSVELLACVTDEGRTFDTPPKHVPGLLNDTKAWASCRLLPMTGISSWKVRIDNNDKNFSCASPFGSNVHLGVCDAPNKNSWTVHLSYGNSRFDTRDDMGREFCSKELSEELGKDELLNVNRGISPEPDLNRVDGAVIEVTVDHDRGTLTWRHVTSTGSGPTPATVRIPTGEPLRPHVYINRRYRLPGPAESVTLLSGSASNVSVSLA